MRRAILLGLVCVFLLTFVLPVVAADAVTFGSLLDEMVDRDRLARLPQPAYTCRQASSYDRDSVAPDKPGWFANWDRSQFVRIEENNGRKEYVLLDEEGPGAIVRFWATWHGPRGGPFSDGTLRFYFDGAAEPAIEGPATEIIDGGRLAAGPLSQGVSELTKYAHRGHNLYLPIPYAKHCKITYHTDVPVDRGAKTGEALYYQINFRTYEPGTQVATFSTEQLKQQAAKLKQVQQRLLQPAASVGGRVADAFDGVIPPGETVSTTIDGPAAVRRLTIKLDAADREQALRSTIAEIAFDGRSTAWCPLGELCGIGYKVRAYRTWYTEVSDDGTMRCYWVMPFERSCTVTLHNLGEQPVTVSGAEILTGPWQWCDRSMHFGATWKQLTKVDTRGGKNMTGNGAFDVNYATIEGQGVYVGDTLTVFNGADAWWGEGDEKIFVDGEPFPSHFGTGTEDYYGYAWCKPSYFCAPFHAQPEGGGNLASGFSVNSRYRSLDAIPFTKRLQVDMEMWHWAGTNMNYAPSTFFYARPGAVHNVKPDPETAAKPVARKREDVVEIRRVEGAIEGESLKPAAQPAGTLEVQAVSTFRWSGDAQLWWRDAKPGDKLALRFPAEKTGRFKVVACLTKAVDYGIVKLSINGKPVAEPIDRFHSQVAHDEIELGTFDIKQGVNLLEVEIVGANTEAIKRHMFGIDYLRLATP